MDWRYHILEKTGYSFYSNETAGMTLEFIGTSGIGKTTLFRKCMRKLKSRWCYSFHVHLLRRQAPSSELDAVLMEILNSRIEKINNSDSFLPWHSFLDLKLSVRVMHETMMLTHCTHPQGFVLDEGFFRHFPAEILQLGDDFPVELWKNKAFVYLRAQTPELALSRLKSRRTAFSQIEVQRDIADDLIVANIMQDQAMFQSIVDRAESFGCPVLVVDAEKPLVDSFKQVMNFERSFGQQFKAQK